MLRRRAFLHLAGHVIHSIGFGTVLRVERRFNQAGLFPFVPAELQYIPGLKVGDGNHSSRDKRRVQRKLGRQLLGSWPARVAKK